MKRGVLIAADRHCEWLIPWFFERLRAVSQLPLAIVDMGLTRGARDYCKARGELIPLEVDHLPHFDTQAAGWYKKPFAFLKTPFEKTLWLDCDCEVVRPVDSLFDFEEEMCLAPDTNNSHEKELSLGTIEPGEVLYNSGVIVFNRGCPLVEDWVRAVSDQQTAFFSDQHVLSRLIRDGDYFVGRLEDDYNWRMSQGFNIHAAIIHWAGSWGKEYIRKHGGLAHELAALPAII